jgi:hypothetical protein
MNRLTFQTAKKLMTHVFRGFVRLNHYRPGKSFCRGGRTTAELLLLLILSVHCPSASGQPTMLTPVIAPGNFLLITNQGSPGDLQFIIKYFLCTSLTNTPNITNIENVIGLLPVDATGGGYLPTNFVPTELTDTPFAFYRARTVTIPAIVGGPGNAIKVRTFPEDFTTTNTGSGSFMVIAEGTLTNVLGYQWFKNGVAIEDATNATYATPPVTLADHGSKYSVDVNMLGHSTVRVGSSYVGGSEAVLNVDSHIPPGSIPGGILVGDGPHAIRVITFPRDTLVTNTSQAQFTVEAQGTTVTNLQYQWLWNGFPIGATNPTATTATLVITNAHFSQKPPSTTSLDPSTDVGFYSVKVNMVGHPPVWVRTADTNAPGALLSLYEGDGTTLYSAYQQSPSPICFGQCSGFVKFLNDTQGTYYNTVQFPAITSNCTITDATPGVTWNRSVYYWSSCKDTCMVFGTLPTNLPTIDFNTTGCGAVNFKFTIYIHNATFPTGAQFALNVNWH